MEQKISALGKKITEQEKIIKMKEKNDEKITQLNKDIQVCLQTTHYFQEMLQIQGQEQIWLSGEQNLFFFFFSLIHAVVNASGNVGYTTKVLYYTWSYVLYLFV